MQALAAWPHHSTHQQAWRLRHLQHQQQSRVWRTYAVPPTIRGDGSGCESGSCSSSWGVPARARAPKLSWGPEAIPLAAACRAEWPSGQERQRRSRRRQL